MENLRVDFYESGIGDTIVITFPGGGLGFVDAHPSPTNSRASILQIAEGKHVHFVCLSHPHADHGVDLIPLLNGHGAIDEFWHTSSEAVPFIYRLGETPAFPNFPSELRVHARKMVDDWANFLHDVYGAVATRKLPQYQIRAGDEKRVIDGVEIHFLSPEREIQQRFQNYWMKKADDPTSVPPDRNLLSSVIALQWGQSVVLLGADAIRENWNDIAERYIKLKLPKAVVLKIPHHGAANSINLDRNKGHTYLDLCRHQEPKCKAVLFAGDSKHPNEKVYERVSSRTETFCLTNGRRGALGAANPLGLKLPGARAVQKSYVCQSQVSFELDSEGGVVVLAGHSCSDCI